MVKYSAVADTARADMSDASIYYFPKFDSARADEARADYTRCDITNPLFEKFKERFKSSE